MNTLEKQIEARLLSAPLYQALSGEGGMPLQEAAARLKNGTLPGHLTCWREEIRQRAPEVQALLRDVWSRHDPAWQTAPDVQTEDPFLDSLDVDITEEYCDPASLQSKLSLASYLRSLYALATELRYEKPADPPETGSVEDSDYLLDTRRPDLGELALSEDNLNQEVSTLRLANEVMVARARDDQETEDALYQRLASSRAAFSLPYNRCQTGMRLGLAMQEENSLNRIALAIREQDNALSDAAYTRAPNVRDQLGLCDEEIRLLKAPATDDTDDAVGIYREVERFLDYTGLSFGELKQMLCWDGIGHIDGREGAAADQYAAWYINSGRVIPAGSASEVVTVIKNDKDKLELTHRVITSPEEPSTPPIITETPVSNTVMGNMLRLARLYRRTGLSFAELDWLLQTACRLAEKTAAAFRLDDAALSLIARYLAWRARDNTTVDAWAGLLCESSPWYQRGRQETAYLSQVYGPRNALWIARYAAETDSGEQRYLGRGAVTGKTLLSPAEITSLQQALHLSQPDWDALLKLVVPVPDTGRLFDWACLAALHRLSLLLHTLGWETGDATDMLNAIAPALLKTLAGGNTDALPGALERLVWLHERLAAWQVTPAALLQMVQVTSGEQQGTQEQVNRLNTLYQNLKPARLTAESFLTYRQVKAENSPASDLPVVIDWLYELQDREATEGVPAFVGLLDADGLVRDNSRDTMNTAVGDIMARHSAPNAGVQQGVLDLLLMAQQSVGILLSAQLDTGDPDDPEENVETLLLLLKWMDRADTATVTAYQVLRTLLAWHLSPERAGDAVPLMDLVTLNASAEVQRNIRRCMGEIARYTRVSRAFRLENSDLQLLADCPDIFTADTADTADASKLLPLDFSLLLTLGQLKGLQRGTAGSDDWGAYFTRRVAAGSEPEELTALQATLGSLLACEEAELAALLQEQPALDNTVPLRVADIDWMDRRLRQARGMQLDYLTFAPVRSMAGKVTAAQGSDQPWEEQQQATAAMVAGQLRAGASLETPARLLEEANRDALVGYLLNGRLNVAGLVRAEQLYSYLLLDVNIGGEVLTTRLAEAVSSVQLCLQRALAGCERATAETRSAVAAVWADSYPYGHWRAGQERILFPANHVDPSLLAGASEGYRAFMSALEQGRLDEEQIHQALGPYLDSLSGLGRATIGNIALLPAEAAGQGEEILWLTACPPGSSVNWYWRELRLSGAGLLTSTPWEKIELAIPRDNFSVPVVLRVNGTLNALWVEHDERPRQSGDGTVDTKRHVYRARRAWRLESGKWGEPEGVWIQPVTPTIKTVDGKDVATHPVKVEAPRVLELLSALPPGDTPCRLGGCWLNTDLWVFRRVFQDESRNKTADSGWQNPEWAGLDILVDGGTVQAQFNPGRDQNTYPVNSQLTGRVQGAVLQCREKITEEVEYAEFRVSVTFALTGDAFAVRGNDLQNNQWHWVCVVKVEPLSPDASPGAISDISLSVGEKNDAGLLLKATLFTSPITARCWGWGYLAGTPVTTAEDTLLKDDLILSLGPQTNEHVWLYVVRPGGPLRPEAPPQPQLLLEPEGTLPWYLSDYTPAPFTGWWLDASSHDEQNRSLGARDGSSPFIYEGEAPTFRTEGTLTLITAGEGTTSFIARPAGGVNTAQARSFSVSFHVRVGMFAVQNNKEIPLLALFDGEDSAVNRAWFKVYLENNDVDQAFLKVRYGSEGAGIKTLVVPGNLEHQKLYKVTLSYAYADDSVAADRRSLCVYLDGKPVVEADGADILVPPALTGVSLFRFAVSGDAVSGATTVNAIGDLRLYRQALTAGQVRPWNEGKVQRLTTRLLSALREQIQPAADGKTFLYTAPNYAALQALPEADMRLQTAKYTRSVVTSKLTAPSVTSEPFSFSGYDGRYGWELFFYMPWLVARRLADSGEYDEALRWLKCIFDPTRSSDAERWVCRPLREGLSALTDDPVPATSPEALRTEDVDALARARPWYYRMAVISTCVRVLTDAGDALYRNPTRESLGQARMYYVMARELFVSTQTLADQQQWLPVNTWSSPRLKEAKAGDFLRPVDETRLQQRAILDARLDNLRHNRTLDGMPLNLPLLPQPPAPDPLKSQVASSGSLRTLAAQQAVPVPHYRFKVMHDMARGFVMQLSQLGSALQQALERDDAEALGQLQQVQQLALLELGQAMQREQIAMAEQQLIALQCSRAASDKRYSHFLGLYQAGVSGGEQTAMDLLTAAGALRPAASTAFAVAAGLDTIPNIYGTSFGGARYGGIAQAVGQGLLMTAEVLQVGADRLLTLEQYRRRSEEWQLQYQQAEQERAGLDAQIAGAGHALAQAKAGLTQQMLQQEQAQATQKLLLQRFGSRRLYQWMGSRLSSLYWQAYDHAASLCRQAEAACQYELGDFSLRFIQTGPAWNSRFRGLLAGEALLLDLQRMELAYQQKNERQREIVKSISLRALSNDAAATAPNQGALDRLKLSGKTTFELTEALFDADYPHHYLRRIRSVSLSFPALLGPYQEVGAELTQLSNRLFCTPGKENAGSKLDLRACQAVALSQGLNDSGLFQLDFSDERYLPFEGTGVTSTWELNFPGGAEAGKPARALLDTLDDVIIQVRYCATSTPSGK